jgi:pimeloyl-ACP methyl ester carboxylesterase
MKKLKNQVLRQEGKKPIVYDVFYKETSHKKPVVVFCHGYKGFKDWGAWNLVAEQFAKAGFFFLKFNFSHNGGTVSQPIDFSDLNAFSENTYTLELEDLKRVLDFLAHSNSYAEEADCSSISLIGHSRGGGIVLIAASENPNIEKVITWASVSDYKRRFNIGSKQFETWKANGVKYVENGRTKQLMPHLYRFYEDFEQNENRLTIATAVENLSQPLLIVHGSEDSTVPKNEAEQLAAWSDNATLQIIEGANHVFGSTHPWNETTLPPQLMEVVRNSIGFLKE